MKAIIASLLLFAATLCAVAETTNGVFYVNSPTECHLISQDGASKTNYLVDGNTYMVGNVLLEMSVTNKTDFYFSGGPLVETGTNTVFTINLFDQDVKNISARQRRAQFGSHNLSLGVSKGELSIVYPNKDANSAFTLTTPFASYELNGGKYLVRVTDNSAVVYVIEGMMQVHGDKRVDKTEKGKRSVAGLLNGEVVTDIKPLKQEETDKASLSVLAAEKKLSDVQFFVMNGNVIGFSME